MPRVLITKRTVQRLFKEAARHRELAARLQRVRSTGRSDTLLQIANRLEMVAKDLQRELHIRKAKSLIHYGIDQ